jgi:phosphopantothenoylcysteine synthetase/decarboxylase
MSRGLKEEVGFSFISDLRKKFFKKYDWKTINNSFAYQLRDFNDEIKSLVKFYEDNPNHTKSGVLLNSLNETADVLRESVEKLLERNEKLNIIAQKSKNLKNTSDDMRTIVSRNIKM